MTKAQEAKGVALIVAVENYSSKKISPVGFAKNDGAALGAALEELGVQVIVLKDSQATR